MTDDRSEVKEEKERIDRDNPELHNPFPQASQVEIINVNNGEAAQNENPADPSTQHHLTPTAPAVERRQLVVYDDDLFSLHSSSPVPVADEVVESASSTDSEGDGILKAALEPIDAEIKGYDGTAAPENGSQFLLLVQKQRKEVPKITSVKPPKGALSTGPDPNKIIKVPMCTQTPASLQEFLPTESWISIVVHQFSNMYLKVRYWREKMEDPCFVVRLPKGVTLPPIAETSRWFVFCFGSTFVKHLKSPRQIHAITTANSRSIASFYSDIDDLSDAKVETTEEALVIGVQDLQISLKKKEIPTHSTETEGNPDSIPITMDNEKIRDESSTAGTATSANDEQNSGVSSLSSSPPPEEEDGLILEKHLPLLSILLSMPTTMVEDLLNMHVRWVKHHGWCHELQGKWIYGLLTCLEKPLSSGVIADIRELARFCCKIRKSVCESKIKSSQDKSVMIENGSGDSLDGQTKTENGVGIVTCDQDLENLQFKEFINTLNLFISLTVNYFQQKDLGGSIQG